jgi:hypothetical protein
MAKAVDDDPDSYWTTETYDTFAKDGVGLVLRASNPARIRSVKVNSDTPGFPAEVRTGSSENGPFTTVIAPSQQVQTSTTYLLTRRAQRYIVVWITGVPAAVAHVNEVRALSG